MKHVIYRLTCVLPPVLSRTEVLDMEPQLQMQFSIEDTKFPAPYANHSLSLKNTHKLYRVYVVDEETHEPVALLFARLRRSEMNVSCMHLEHRRVAD